MNDFMGEAPVFEAISRPNVPALDAMLGDPHKVLDKGFIRVIDYMGDEAAISQAARVSYGKGTKGVSEDRGLLRYLMRHWHTTPFEMCELKIHVKLPIFVARQWIRHRTANVNEYSARYSIMRREFHIPDVGDLAKQSIQNKQGRGDGIDDLRAEEVKTCMVSAANSAFDVYEYLIDEDGDFDLARETAREVLPMSTYTEWYWKVDLHNLLHFLRLRADPHAQAEIRAYADVLCKIVMAWLPNVWDAFEDYRLCAHTFSKHEMEALRLYLSEVQDFCEDMSPPTLCVDGVSDRERKAFFAALGVDP